MQESDLFDLKNEHLVGKLIFAPQENCTIGQVSVPLAKDFLVLTASDLKDSQIRVLSDYYPILADNVVKYKNQAVMAVFGPDYESVELFSREIKIEYIPLEASWDPVAIKTTEREWGNASEYFTEEASVFTSKFDVSNHMSSNILSQRVHAATSEGKVHIQCASQWPTHLKRQVAKELGIDESSVLFYPQEYHAPYDQLVIMPTVMAILAATASVKTGKMVELSEPMFSSQPTLHFELETAYSEETKLPLAHRVTVTADLGVYPMFMSEYCNELIAGLAPSYPVEALKITASILTSQNPPCCFFKDLGYGMAVAATEAHFSKLAQKLNFKPSDYREILLTSAPELTIKRQIISSSVADSLIQTLRASIVESTFNRQYATSNQRTILKHTILPFVQYSRGIGIATGEGIEGFSADFPFLPDYGLYVSLSEDEKVHVSSAMHTASSNMALCRDIIQQYLGVDPGNITFSNINDPQVPEAGPNALSRSIKFLSVLIEEACIKLAEKKNAGQLPATETVTMPVSKTLFTSDCNGTVVIALHIDLVSLIPVIDQVTVRLSFGKVLSLNGLKKQLKFTILQTLNEICPEIDSNFEIDIKIASNQSKPLGSAESLVRGLTASAFIRAMSQACNLNLDRLPISQKDIAGIMRLEEEFTAKIEPEEKQEEKADES